MFAQLHKLFVQCMSLLTLALLELEPVGYQGLHINLAHGYEVDGSSIATGHVPNGAFHGKPLRADGRNWELVGAGLLS